MTTNRLQVSLPGLELKNPIIPASGCFGFGQDIPIIDANVVRVLTRIFDLPETRRTGNAALKEIAGRLLPEDQALNYNEALLDFAALICKKRPLCDKCPLAHLCDSRRKIN